MDRSIPAPAALLLDFIGDIEAPKGYDTIYGNKQRHMRRKLTNMTFGEVVAAGPGWTKANGSSAAGRYQFMRDTLDKPRVLGDLAAEMGISNSEPFSADLQDRMAMHLLRRRGYDKFISGRMSVPAFALSLAKEWASLPVLGSTKGQKRQVTRGQSYYAGDGLNKSLISPEKVETVLRKALAIAQDGQGVPIAVEPPLKYARPVEPAVAPPVAATASKGKWATLLDIFRGKPPAAVSLPPAANVPGDPTVYSVQQQLLSKGYAGVRRADGIMGPRTGDAISLIQKHNGMAMTGVITPEFVAILPSLPARDVSMEQATATKRDAKEQVPEVTKPLVNMQQSGWWLGGLAGLGGLKDSGLLDSIQSTSDQATATLTSVQAGINTIAAVITWVVQHWYLFVGAFGFYILLRAGYAILKLVVLLRQGRLL